MRRSASEAVDLETNPVSPWYALARAGYGAALYFCGEFQAAARQLEQALVHGSSIALVRMLSFAMMSLVAVEEGRLDQAEQLAHSARDIVTDDALGLSESPQASIAALAVGAVLAWGYLRIREPLVIRGLRALHTGSANDYAAYAIAGTLAVIAVLSLA